MGDGPPFSVGTIIRFDLDKRVFSAHQDGKTVIPAEPMIPLGGNAEDALAWLVLWNERETNERWGIVFTQRMDDQTPALDGALFSLGLQRFEEKGYGQRTGVWEAEVVDGA